MKDYLPKSWKMGVGLLIPEFFPIEVYADLNSFVSLRVYYGVPLPFKVTVDYTRGVLANQGEIAIENPDLTIHFDGTFGPIFGMDVVYRPWGGSFFTSFGFGSRRLELDGGVQSNLILTSSAGSINTNSEIDLDASAWVQQSVARLSIGWTWDILDDHGYLTFIPLGYLSPFAASSGVTMKANLINPKATIPVENAILEEAERKFEEDLASQTREDVRPVETLGTPMIGFAIGMRFE